MAKAIRLKDPKALESKIAKLIAKLALMDVNNIRLSRKYECLQAEESELR
jgi:hypothetical protein